MGRWLRGGVSDRFCFLPASAAWQTRPVRGAAEMEWWRRADQRMEWRGDWRGENREGIGEGIRLRGREEHAWRLEWREEVHDDWPRVSLGSHFDQQPRAVPRPTRRALRFWQKLGRPRVTNLCGGSMGVNPLLR